MAAQPELKEDPLIAALPPATDFITYLTLLEYQLTPNNLPTLNRLLSEDDGTLASEIGWDLLKLVLPMIQVVPDEANKCLEIIARRGNPREVVVRVAEELERLGDSSADHESDVDTEDSQDELPTFAGEATRVHLGTMTLDGMPPQEQIISEKETTMPNESYDSHAESGSDDVLSLQALLSMLSVLHPRIKTQYPSRFLATSLPAALGAYRQLPITVDTTLAFISFLGKLSGNQRPALPPRASTAGSTSGLTLSQTTSTNKAAPLPDPEADPTNVGGRNSTPGADEKAIIQKLLQAVALEVLDEYTNSLRQTEAPHMSWTSRLREKLEPNKVVPGRVTENLRWQDTTDLKSRDEMILKFIKLSKDLRLDVSQGIHHLIGDDDVDDEEEVEEQPVTEYPTSPKSIPFPSSGLVLLFAAQQFYQSSTTSSSTSSPTLETSLAILRKYRIAVDPDHLATADAVLSLLYTALNSPATETKSSDESSVSQNILLSLQTLTDLFITNPDPSVRDSAHHIATKLLHEHVDSSTKLTHIKHVLSPPPNQPSPIHSIQEGNLKAVAIDWLRNEIALGGLEASILSTDPELTALVLPRLPAVPGPFISSHPPRSSTGGAPPMSTEQDLESLLLHIPAYIAGLNLICILANLTPVTDDHPHEQQTSTSSQTQDLHSSSTSTAAAPPSSSKSDPPISSPSSSSPSVLTTEPLLTLATEFLHSLEGWKDNLLGLLIAATSTKDSDRQQGPVDPSDIYALEDAVNRAGSAIRNLDD